MRAVIATILCLCVMGIAVPVDETTAVQASTEKLESPEEVTYTLIATSSSKVPNANVTNPVAEVVTSTAAPTTKVTRTRGTRPSRSTTNRITRVTKRKTTSTTTTTVAVPTSEALAEEKIGQSELPMTRQEWLKLIENEMLTYEQKQGNSPISNKNLTIISNRILKFLLENGTSYGIEMQENKAKNVIVLLKNTNKNATTSNDKVYGEGTVSKFPPTLEYVLSRIQNSWSIYKYEDQSRLPSTESATLREAEDSDSEEDSKETSTSNNEEVFSQLEEELNDYLDPSGNGTKIKLPTLIKTAYDKFTSWLVPQKPNAKEEPISDEGEDENESETEVAPEGTKKKPSIIKTAVEAIETIWSIFDESDGEEEEDKTSEVVDGAEKKESPDDESSEDKDSVPENILDFLNLAYSLYEVR